MLSLLANKPMYGYQLVKEVGKQSNGYFCFKDGTLYPALRSLDNDGLIEGKWETTPSGQACRYYDITPKGEVRLKSMLKEWHQFMRAVILVTQFDTT